MATTSSKPNSRRVPPSLPTTTPLVARGAAARSVASPRLSSFPANARRPPSKSASPTPIINGESHEALSASLKLETDQKEELLLRLQDKDQLISNYVTENLNLISSLTAAETRVNDLYAEQSRWEMELAQRLDISEKLRDQVRDLEREKRDVQRRYNEQTATFDAERQAFYDNEQHLKSRIQSLTQARKRVEPITNQVEIEHDNELVVDDIPPSPASLLPNDPGGSVKKDLNDPENEPAEMTSLKLELSTLSTSYSSLQSTLMLMQTQLMDLKRVNQELQEENESYMILLREKTLSGQFDLMKQVGSTSDDGSDDERESTDVGSMLSLGRNTLDRVEEEAAEVLDPEVSEDMSDSSAAHSLRSSRRPRRVSSQLRGESLADLPITGPGLDLAAELGRAENKDLLAGDAIDDRDRPFPGTKGKQYKKSTEKLSHSENTGIMSSTSTSDIDALRTEVKSLKDANKALSLYASKIIDRIIAQEGFEHVLAVDYDKELSTPSTATPHPSSSKPLPSSGTKPRPQSVIINRSSSNPNPSIDKRLGSPNPQTSKPSTKAQRRSLSFDWKGFSIFSEKKPEIPSHLRPLTLTPGASSVTSMARKLDNHEDEEDRKERERLHATMKLMGIQPTQSSLYPSPTYPSPSTGLDRSVSLPSNAKTNRRFSLFGSGASVENSDASSVHSTASSSGRYDIRQGPPNLTQEALEHAEAENSLAVLDAHERDLSAEIAKGSNGGFTEIAPRVGRKSRRSAGGSSGSTVWSAGMSGTGDEQ